MILNILNVYFDYIEQNIEDLTPDFSPLILQLKLKCPPPRFAREMLAWRSNEHIPNDGKQPWLVRQSVFPLCKQNYSKLWMQLCFFSLDFLPLGIPFRRPLTPDTKRFRTAWYSWWLRIWNAKPKKDRWFSVPWASVPTHQVWRHALKSFTWGTSLAALGSCGKWLANELESSGRFGNSIGQDLALLCSSPISLRDWKLGPRPYVHCGCAWESAFAETVSTTKLEPHTKLHLLYNETLDSSWSLHPRKVNEK